MTARRWEKNDWAAVRAWRDVNFSVMMLLGPIPVQMLDLPIGSMALTGREGPSTRIVSDATRMTYADMTESRISRPSDSAVRPKRVAPLGPLESVLMLPVAEFVVTLSAVGTVGTLMG